MEKEGIGVILALMTAVISGFSIPINKVFVVGLDPAVFTAVRALIIGIVFLILAMFRSDFDLRRFRGIDWKSMLFIGIVGGGLAFLSFFTGLSLTTGGRAAFLHKTLPVFAGIFAAVFLKERMPRKHWCALVVMLAGAFMVYFARIPLSAWWSNPGLGDLLIIGATILWAAENTVARKVMKAGESNLMVSFSRMFIGALFLFGIVGVSGRADVLLTMSGEQVANLFISTGFLFGYVLFWYWSLKYLKLAKAAAILLIAPVISLATGIAWLSEPAPLLQIAGSALIVAGAFVVVRLKGIEKRTAALETGM